jgi:hypothetical protein
MSKMQRGALDHKEKIKITLKNNPLKVEIEPE